MTQRTRFDTELGRRITQRLAKAAVTQRALARLLGMPHASLNQMITGRMAPRIALEAEIEAALTAVERTGNTVGP